MPMLCARLSLRSAPRHRNNDSRSWMAAQRRPVANQPLVAERIDEAALPVSSPRHLMVPDAVETALRARLHRPSNERIWIIAEHLHSRGGRAQLQRSFPTVLLRFAEEYRRAIDFHSHDRSEVPELCRTEGLLVPRERCRCIRDCEHYRDQRLAFRRHEHPPRTPPNAGD